jgi:hypothetical protein
MTTDQKQAIRSAVKLAMQYWPNSHLGDYTPREDMRSAFTILRSHAERDGILPAIAYLETSAYRHANM